MVLVLTYTIPIKSLKTDTIKHEIIFHRRWMGLQVFRQRKLAERILTSVKEPESQTAARIRLFLEQQMIFF